MTLRLKGCIAHSHDTKLLGEDGEDTTIDLGTRPSPRVKPFGEDLRDILTHSWGNIPKPKKDSIGIDVQGPCNNQLEEMGEVESIFIPPKVKPTYGASRQSFRKESHIRRNGKRSGPRKVYTHPTVGRGQTKGCGNTTDRYPIDRGGVAIGGQTDGCIHSIHVTTQILVLYTSLSRRGSDQ